MFQARTFKFLLSLPHKNFYQFRRVRSRAVARPRADHFPGRTDEEQRWALRALGDKATTSFQNLENDEDLDELTRAQQMLKGAERYKVKNALKKAHKRILQLNFDHIPVQDRIILMFPGQGTQHLKMGEKIIDNPNSMRLFDEAKEVLKFDLLDLCLNGPKNKLDQVYYSQLAIFVCSLAALEKLKAEQPDLQDRLTDCAGFDIGEMCALVASEVLTFSDALEIVKVRAKSVSDCCQLASSGMVTIRTCANSDLNKALKEARQYSEEQGELPICDIASYLFCHTKVVAGTNKALEHFTRNATHFRIQVLKGLPIYGALNTRMMDGATKQIEHLLSSGNIELRVPRVNVYSNYTGKCHTRHLNTMAKHIARQANSPVKWEQIMQILFNKRSGDTFPSYLEVGSGQQLGKILYNVGKKASKTYLNYSV